MSATSILCVLCSFFSCYDAHRYLHSFPTRRSSDLLAGDTAREARRRETRPTRRARSRDLVDGLRGAQPSAPRTRLVGMSDDFVHLHVHTDYSMLDGAAKIDKLVEDRKSVV